MSATYKLVVGDRVEFDVKFTLNDGGEDKPFGMRLSAKRQPLGEQERELGEQVKVQEFLAAQDTDTSSAGLRLGVRGGGCSGFQYQLAFDEQRDGDIVFEDQGLRVFVDNQSLPYVHGSQIDYIDHARCLRRSRHSNEHLED
jgi:iron-sulfur cluster assembly accessory protein